jgi:purine nucleosidase
MVRRAAKFKHQVAVSKTHPTGTKMPTPRRIIIDTDPGQDDAVAILLALGSAEIEVAGITCVAGNVPLKLTENNARKICELAGRPDIGVFAGAVRPLMRQLVTAERFTVRPA